MTTFIETYQENYHKVYKICGVKFKIRYKKYEIFNFQKIEPNVKNYKYVHLMNNGIHSVNIINFINKYFDNNEHCFIFPCIMFYKTQVKLKGIKNVFYCSLDSIDVNVTDKIIIHGLFDTNLVKALCKHKNLISKTYWFIWGGDLYSAPNSQMDNYVRTNVAGILTSFDKEVYEEKYGRCNSYFDVTYPHDITADTVNQDLKEEGITHIQINNSADVTTLEMLDILSKFKDENIKISTILSYVSAGQKDFSLKIMKKGFEIFGSKFSPIIEFMPKEEYANYLATVDIYISNQDRQQGNGNTTFIYSLGGKIFLKNNTTVYKKYNSLGIKIFDACEIPDMSFEEFCYFDEKEKQKSILLLKERMKDETKVKQWREFFDA